MVLIGDRAVQNDGKRVLIGDRAVQLTTASRLLRQVHELHNYGDRMASAKAEDFGVCAFWKR